MSHSASPLPPRNEQHKPRPNNTDSLRGGRSERREGTVPIPLRRLLFVNTPPQRVPQRVTMEAAFASESIARVQYKGYTPTDERQADSASSSPAPMPFELFRRTFVRIMIGRVVPLTVIIIIVITTLLFNPLLNGRFRQQVLHRGSRQRDRESTGHETQVLSLEHTVPMYACWVGLYIVLGEVP